MYLVDLKTRIQETLGLDVISLPGLVTLVNNCIASMESKDYREFVEEETVLEPTPLPIEHDQPEALKKLLYVKVQTESGIFKCLRKTLTDPTIQERKLNGVYRTSASSPWMFYVKNNKIYIDAGDDCDETIEKIIVGYYKTIPKLSFDITLDQLNGTNGQSKIEIDIRPSIESGFVFYGLAFYANRFKFRPEVVDMYNKDYKYFVEDMLVQLDSEDRYFEEDDIETVIEL